MSSEKNKVHRPSKGRATVVDDPNLQKDLSTGAVINRNHTDYSKRLSLKKAMREKESQISKLEDEVAELRELVNQILKKTGSPSKKKTPVAQREDSIPPSENPNTQ